MKTADEARNMGKLKGAENELKRGIKAGRAGRRLE